MNPEPSHTQFDGAADYSEALDTLCKLATRSLCVFEKDFDGIGFNSEKRYEILRAFLLANPYNSLHLVAHDVRYLANYCPRMTMLLRQFSHNMQIYRTPPHLLNLSEPFAVADEAHYVRRFHFDDTRGVLAQNDPPGARTLQSQFTEIWSASRTGVSPSTTGL